jgi:hypothetical protein
MVGFNQPFNGSGGRISMPVTGSFFRKVLSVVCLFGVGTLQAAVVDLPPVMDATLFEDEQGRLANGAGQYLFIGLTWDENGIENLLRRTVLKFDVSAIPAGSTINYASVSLTIDRVPPEATPATVNMHRLTQAWGEGASNAPGPEGRGTLAQPGDATWLHTFYDSGSWTAPGGDFAQPAVASKAISSSEQPLVFESSPALVADVQSWLDTPSGNHGWILLGDEVFGKNARRLLSRENSLPGGPLLTIEYTEPVPEVFSVPALSLQALVLLALSLAAAGAYPGFHRRKRLLNRS